MPPTPITSNTLDLSVVSGVDDPLIAQLRKQGRATTLDLSTGYASYVPQRPGAYLRLSKEDINEERRTRKKETNRKTAIERQTEDVEVKRKALGWGRFARLYEDYDVSAYKKKRVVRQDGTVDWVVLRPEFQRMLKDLLSGEIDGVIFYDLDRLVRQPRDLEDLANVVNETKRPAIGATSELNLVRESDCNMARIMCVMLLKQSQDTSRRIARETLAAAEVGIPIGKLGFGWVRKGENLGRIIEEDAEIVRRIFREFLDGETPTGIARELNLDGIPSPAGKMWDNPTVKVIITNPRYAGMALYRGTHRRESSKQHDGISKLLTDDEGNPLMGSWDAIISPNEWFKAQNEMVRRREDNSVDTTNYGGRERGKYLLSGIVRCSKCRTPMEGRFDKKRGYPAYRCPTRGRGSACGATSRKMEPLDELVDLLMQEFIERELDTSTGDDEERRKTIARRKELEAEEQGHLQEKKRIEDKWQSGKLAELGWTEDDYDEHIGRISKNLRETAAKISALEHITEPLPAQEVSEQWRTGSVLQKRALLKRYTEGFQLLPSPRGRGAFDPKTVIPLWRNRKNPPATIDRTTEVGT